MKLIHLTDTHLVNPGETLYGLDPYARLNAAIDDINRCHADADICVVTGDLTHRAEPGAYRALRQCLERLQPPCVFTLGNHDDRQEMSKHFPDLQTDPAGFLQSRVQTASGGLYLLDTVKAGTHAGAYCAQRRAWLRAQLEAHRNEPAFLFMHHPPFKVGVACMDAIGIAPADAQAMAALLSGFNNVRHIFFGHLHRPLNGNWRGISFSTIRATNHQVWLDFSATDEIPGSHEPPAYAVVLIDDDQVVVHAHDFLDTSPRFSIGSWDWEQWRLELLGKASA